MNLEKKERRRTRCHLAQANQREETDVWRKQCQTVKRIVLKTLQDNCSHVQSVFIFGRNVLCIHLWETL